jgi:precorrin-3B synthase
MTRARSSVEPPPSGAPSPLRRAPAPRGACPSLVAPMATGDGLIARLLPTDGALTTQALAALADAARAFGNGIVEVTQRGSLQLRGIRTDTVEALEAAALGVGAAPPPGPPVHVGPLAGLDPAETADPRPLAAALRARLAAAADALPPKLAIVVDGGGRWPLDGLSADLRLTAVATPDGPMWRLASDVAAISPPLSAAAAVEAAQAAVSQLCRSERRRPAPRVPRPPIGLLLAAAFPAAGLPETALGDDDSGIPHAGDGSAAAGARVAAAGIALPFGHTDADRLGALVAAADSGGADGVRLTPGHGLVFVGPRRGWPAPSSGRAVAPGFDPAALLAAAAGLGFVTRPDDPRLALSVCAGAPACGSGEAPTRPLADAVVAAAAPLIAAGGEVHLSGCTKGCARARSGGADHRRPGRRLRAGGGRHGGGRSCVDDGPRTIALRHRRDGGTPAPRKLRGSIDGRRFFPS